MSDGVGTETKYRTERDSLGEMEVPADALYGASTQRAVLNFPISGIRFPRVFLRALGLIKRYAAEVNAELGLLDRTVADAIVQAAQEVADGAWDDHFPLDIYQTGSGTSTNTNANEVIANRAIEILGGERGSKRVHPNDHVNLGQSSNDVIPTAIHLSALLSIREQLRPALQRLAEALRGKAEEFMPIVKTGRTHLMDATPIRLGQEFAGYAGHVESALRHLEHAEQALCEVPLGGTAVGTGTNRHPEFAERVCARLQVATGIPVREASNHFQAQACLDAVVLTSGVLRTYATALMKVANDIRWMGSGPHAGLAELELPAVQPGSSIMPGKVNPVIAESVIQVCAQVQGNDLVVALGNQWGNFELNTMMPVMAHNLLQSISLLAAASANFARQCVEGLRATPRGPETVERGLMLATALAPVIGYDAAAEIAKEAARTGRTIRDIARERTQLSDEDLARILDPSRMTEPGFTTGGGG
ncbi:MAG: class II fumarate hydratase [Armatimonadota bacterium]|nr:class II fumarate hydratase [Armatimonadota bacterium]MDR5698022.1 class II fumarate hydratase [Armatimonadota bacterium]